MSLNSLIHLHGNHTKILKSLDMSSLGDKYKPADICAKFAGIFSEVNHGTNPNSIYNRTRSEFCPKIALRMTKGPSNSCIDFHCDGGYATSTSQIPLNSRSEYVGGKLCFFVNDQVHEVPRPPGSLVQHPPQVLHAVTSVTEGVRKSLFLVDHSNGLTNGIGVVPGYEMGGVVTLRNEHVASFLAQRQRT